MLKSKEIEIIAADLWYVPLEHLEEVCALVKAIRERCGYDRPVDDSDEWTEEDRREAANEALRRLDETDPYDWPVAEQEMNEVPPYRRIRLEVAEETSGPRPEHEGRK